MPSPIVWTEAQDVTIRRMRAEGARWDDIGKAMGVCRSCASERGQVIGATAPPKDFIPYVDPERGCLPAGSLETWGAMIAGTTLDGMAYPAPEAVR